MPTYKMLLSANGTTAFFKDGEQVPEIQRNGWIKLQLQELQRHGIDPRDVEIRLWNGEQVHPFVTDEARWNYSLQPIPEGFEASHRPMPPLPTASSSSAPSADNPSTL